jgi:hypothetical protein
LKGESFHQEAAPPWAREIADEAVLPSGVSVAGTKARVFHLLRLSSERGHQFRIGRHLAPPGWVPTWVLREPWAGGSAGDRRLRDLREAGLAIDSERHVGDEGESGSWMWRLSRENQRKNPVVATAQVSFSRLAFSCSLGSPERPDTSHIDVTPGSGTPFAPSWEVARRALAGEDGGCLYRQELLERWRAGDLDSAVNSLPRTPVTFFCREGAAFNPLPVLGLSLTKLGARSLETA